MAVSGRVLDDASGAPIPQARVFIQETTISWMPASEVTSVDSEGRYRIERTLSHPSDLVVLANGFRPWRSPAPLAPGAQEIEIRMRRGASIRGHVVDDTGAAVRGARVWARLPQNQIYWPRTSRIVSGAGDSDGAEGTSAEDGSIELSGVGDAIEYVVEAARQGMILDKGVSARAGADPVTLRLRLVARVHLVVAGTDRSEPLSDVGWVESPEPSLRSRDDGASRERRRMALLDSDAPSPARQPAARVFEYTFVGESGPRPERVGYHFAAPGYEPKPVWIPLEWGRTVEHRVELTPMAGERRRVRLRAELPGGVPYTGGLAMMIFPPGGGSVWSGTVPSVSLAFVHGLATRVLYLPIGVAALELFGTGADDGLWWGNATEGRNVMVEITSGSGELEATLHLRGNPVTLDVRDESGRRVRGYSLAMMARMGMREEEGWDIPWLHQAEGKLIPMDEAPRIWLGPGTHTIRASIPGVGSGASEVQLTGDGTPRAIHIVLKR